VKLPGGEERNWVMDGDTVVMRATAQAAGAVSIGFGECGGEVLPARAWPTAAQSAA